MSMVTIVFNSYLATYGCTVDMAGLEMELSGTFLLYSLLILMLEAQCDLHSWFLFSYLNDFFFQLGREIDEALRPGVYALVDACSEDDLQRLHTVFGGEQSQPVLKFERILSY